MRQMGTMAASATAVLKIGSRDGFRNLLCRDLGEGYVTLRALYRTLYRALYMTLYKALGLSWCWCSAQYGGLWYVYNGLVCTIRLGCLARRSIHSHSSSFFVFISFSHNFALLLSLSLHHPCTFCSVHDLLEAVNNNPVAFMHLIMTPDHVTTCTTQLYAVDMGHCDVQSISCN